MLSMFPALFMLVLVGAILQPPADARESDAAAAEAERRESSLSEEISFIGAGGFELHGTLRLPTKASDHLRPALLLLPGSGPTDRNGNQLPMLKTDLLKQVADHLADEEILTLCFDKRACAVYADQWPTEGVESLNEFFAWEHFVADAEAAVAYLRDDPRVDPDRVVIFGHSEGGLIALSVAARQQAAGTPIHGLILAGTAGRTLDVVVREQIDRMLRLGGVVEDRRLSVLAEVDRAVMAVKEEGRVPTDVMPGLRALFNPTAADVLKAYFTTDPLELVRTFRGPVLVLNGEHDSQVSAVRDARRLEIALDERLHRRAGYEVVIVPEASHNFKHAETLLTPAFVGPVVPATLEAISRWVQRELAPEPATEP